MDREQQLAHERSEHMLKKAKDLGANFVKTKIDKIVPEIEDCVDEDGDINTPKLVNALAKWMSLAYSLGYMDGDKGETIKKLFI